MSYFVCWSLGGAIDPFFIIPCITIGQWVVVMVTGQEKLQLEVVMGRQSWLEVVMVTGSGWK